MWNAEWGLDEILQTRHRLGNGGEGFRSVVDTGWVTQVRTATARDALGVARVHVRSWQVAYRGLIAQDYLDGLRPEDKASTYTFDRTGEETPAILVAVEEDVIRGFAITGPSQDNDLPDAGALWAIYIDPPYWGMGMGRLLMAAGRDQLRQDGAHEALLWVLAGNHRARRFYELTGWRSDGASRMEAYGGVTVEEMRYRCALS